MSTTHRQRAQKQQRPGCSIGMEVPMVSRQAHCNLKRELRKYFQPRLLLIN
jgi:hypothetical protein